MLDLDEVNLHIFMSYMTSNIPSSIVLESLLSVLERPLFLYGTAFVCIEMNNKCNELTIL